MIGSNIYVWMRASGLTQKELAEKAHISQSALSEIINGKSQPSEGTRRALASALGIAVEILEAEQSAELLACPRCGSRSLVEWLRLDSGACRLRCGYCELDTGEQASKEKAIAMLESFRAQKAPQKAFSSSRDDVARVLTFAELQDSSAYDSEDIRPCWFENRGLFIVPALLQNGVAERELAIVKVEWHGSFGTKSFMLNQYNSWWRVWNSKPTTEQSEATPWND